jgi:hypothetical protein
MRRVAIALSITLAMLALIPAAASARGPQKNDSVNGHGFVVVDPTTTFDFKVSAHTLSSTTTAATGNMWISALASDATGTTIKLQIWADVFCTSVLTINGEVRGHIYRTEPDLLTAPSDLVFNVSDQSPFSNLPDLFSATTTPSGVAGCTEPPPPGEFEVAKGEITVNDEGPPAP